MAEVEEQNSQPSSLLPFDLSCISSYWSQYQFHSSSTPNLLFVSCVHFFSLLFQLLLLVL